LPRANVAMLPLMEGIATMSQWAPVPIAGIFRAACHTNLLLSKTQSLVGIFVGTRLISDFVGD